MTLVTTHLSTSEYQLFKQKADQLGISEYELAKQGILATINQPTDLIKAKLILYKLMEKVAVDLEATKLF